MMILDYINNNARRFYVYVANRIQYIRDCTEPSQWHHVKGKDNPADEASRSMTAKELLNNDRWIKGPDMLWEAEVLLTSKSSCFTELAEDDVKVRTCLKKDNQATPRENDNQAAKSETTTLLSDGTEVKSFEPIRKYLDCFSTWHQAKSWIAAIKRGIRRVRERIASKRHNNQDKGTVSELQQAENFIGGTDEHNASKTGLNSTKIKDILFKQGCDLIEVKLNVPHASHMGGVWERMIRSVRSVLSSLLNQLGTQLVDEALRTLMTEAENVINSRSLTISDLSDLSAAEPLTPNRIF